MHSTHDDVARSEVLRKADLCTAALLEAERLSGAAMFGVLYARLTARVTAMLEELDEELLCLDHTRDRGAFERVAALHRGLEQLQVRQDRLGAH